MHRLLGCGDVLRAHGALRNKNFSELATAQFLKLESTGEIFGADLSLFNQNAADLRWIWVFPPNR